MINYLLIKKVLLLRETPKDFSAVLSPQCLKSSSAPETPVSMLPLVIVTVMAVLLFYMSFTSFLLFQIYKLYKRMVHTKQKLKSLLDFIE